VGLIEGTKDRRWNCLRKTNDLSAELVVSPLLAGLVDRLLRKGNLSRLWILSLSSIVLLVSEMVALRVDLAEEVVHYMWRDELDSTSTECLSKLANALIPPLLENNILYLDATSCTT